MYLLQLKHHFDAAHYLRNYDGKCANLHGHRWNVIINIKTNELKNDMVVDFGKLKEEINTLDHQSLNDVYSPTFNPTAENIAEDIHHRIHMIFDIPKSDISVTVFESPEASITYTEE